MSTDARRIAPYRAAVAAAALAHKEWLEVGPGPHAVLTSLVLTQPGTRIVAIEGNAAAAGAARAFLAGKFDAARWRVVEGMSNSVAVAAACVDASARVSAVVSEVLGLTASAEHILDIVEDLRERHFGTPTAAAARAARGLEPTPVFLPRWAATFFCPQMLDPEVHLALSLRRQRAEGVGVALPRG